MARSPGVRGSTSPPTSSRWPRSSGPAAATSWTTTTQPTTLTLSDDATSGALEQLLEIVRNPAMTFNQAALRKRSALERFKAGKLGMILGYRDLTPELRAQQT